MAVNTMKYKIAICDDEQNQIEYISSIVSMWEKQLGCVCDISTFHSAEAFLFDYWEDRTYDILLLDVEMKNMNGIELAKRIRKNNNRSKPISADKLLQVLTKAAEKLSSEPSSVVIVCDGETVKLYESEILYAESFLHYIVIHTKDTEYKIKESISAFEKKLSDDFYRIHRSYLVSLKHITRISRTSIHIGSIELPLSRGKYDDINRTFIEHN